jgi:hypothetical protein
MRWLMRLLLVLGLLSAPTQAAPPPGTDLDSPTHKWFHDQYSVKGVWCCDVSDGHLLDDEDWRPSGHSDEKQSGYEVRISGRWLPIPSEAMRDPQGGPNPTHKAVVWYTISEVGVLIYCFAPGYMG